MAGSRLTKHPMEKSLAIFPLVPPTKILVSNPFSSSLSPSGSSSFCGVASRMRRGGANRLATTDYKRVVINFSQSSFPPCGTNKTNFTSKLSGERRPLINITNNNNFSSVKQKLDLASKYLPKKQGPLTGKLPPIVSSHPSIDKKFPKLNPCTCGRKRTHHDNSPRRQRPLLKEELVDWKFKELAKTFRPEETPRLLSVYVRWKTGRDGVMEYDQQKLIETFTTFGEITNVVYTSDNSAIVVFSTVDAASTATKVLMKIGREMRLNVKWLNDMH